MTTDVNPIAALSRVLVALVGLALLVAGLALVVWPATSLAYVEGWLAAVQRGQVPLAAIGAVVACVGLLLLALGLWPATGRRTATGHVGESVIHYHVRAIESSIANELAGVEGVLRARVQAWGRRDGVEASIHLVMDASYDPQDVVARATARVHDKLERGMGLRVHAARMTIDRTEYPRYEPRTQPPAAPPPPPHEPMEHTA